MGWPFFVSGLARFIVPFPRPSISTSAASNDRKQTFVPFARARRPIERLGYVAWVYGDCFLAEVWNRCLLSSMLKSILNGASISLLVRLVRRNDLDGVKSVSVKNLTNAFWMPGMTDKALLFFQKVRSTNSHSICRRTDNG